MKTASTPIPAAALLQHIAIVGKTGSGKTFTAKGIVEQLLDQGRRVCVLDPTGAWWGLKSSANGKDAGYPVVIFGGDHADVPLTEHAGEALGKLIATTNVPSVLDLSEMGSNERHRFAELFFEGLYRHNKTALHLITDEADEFAPQSGPPGTEVMLGRFDRIVRRGRIKGFRVIMISQRPAVLNKNALTQANTLIAMKLPSSQDRKAVELWIKGQGDESQATAMIKSLASLKRGEGWVWAPEEQVLELVKFPAIKTFDSSRTPDDGETIAAPKRLADVDLSEISAAMAAAIEEAKANDPAELKKQIAELKKKLAAVPAAKATPAADPSIAKKQAEYVAALEKRAADFESLAYRRLKEFQQVAELVAQRSSLPIWSLKTPQPLATGSRSSVESYRRPTLPAVNGRTTTVRAGHRGHMRLDGNGGQAPAGGNRAAGDDGATLTAAQRRILDALAWLKSIGNTIASVPQAALLAGMNHQGGYFNNTLGSLSTAGLVLRRNGTLELTEAGDQLANAPETVLSLDEFHKQIRTMLDKMKGGLTVRLFDAIVQFGNREVTVEDLAAAVNASMDGGYFNNSLGPLGTLGLVERRKGVVHPTEILFPPQLS